MRSKRAGIGNFVSNYFALIFLALILGVFIITSPIIKIAVGESKNNEESFGLDGYKTLYYLQNEDKIKSNDLFNISMINLFFVGVSVEDYPIYFRSNNLNELFIYIGNEGIPIKKIKLSYENPSTYFLNNREINGDIYFNIHGNLSNLKSSNDELRLETLKNFKEVSYEV